MNNLYNLIDGKIGKVVEVEVGSIEFEGKKVVFDEDGIFEIDGIELCNVCEEEDGIDEFGIKDDDKLLLVKGDGYRGVCCYEGILVRDGEWYCLDVMNEYMVYKLDL